MRKGKNFDKTFDDIIILYHIIVKKYVKDEIRSSHPYAIVKCLIKDRKLLQNISSQTANLVQILSF